MPSRALVTIDKLLLSVCSPPRAATTSYSPLMHAAMPPQRLPLLPPLNGTDSNALDTAAAAAATAAADAPRQAWLGALHILQAARSSCAHVDMKQR
jgi:hypothetical protein